MRQVVVTGGGTGIGRAVAAAFAAAGDEVVITGRRPDVLAKTAADLGPSVRPVPFDAADPAQVTAALERPAAPGERAGPLRRRQHRHRCPRAGRPGRAGRRLAANLDANVLSAVLVTTALRPRLAPGGAVISLSSIAAHRSGAAAYGAAKAAVEAWNLTLAADLGSDRITANVISPGYIEDTEFFRDRMTPQRRATLIGQTFTGRAGNPADIAGTALFLASPAASHITAQVLHVNGGALSGR